MIHKYSLNGFHIVLDTNSGAVHLFDDAPFDMLDYLNDSVPENPPREMLNGLSGKYDGETVREAYEELKELYRIGQLFSMDEYGKFAEMMKDAPVKSMCLNIAHDCNLRCEYCFAAKGDFGRGRMLMPFAVGKRAIDFLIEKSEGRHNLEVDFFGGEPLMNFEVVKQIVNYARSIEKEHNKNFRFTITTNGILLTDDKIDFINREMSNCVLSLDGRKSVNDLLRVRADGTGSYDTIVPKFQKLVASRGDKDYYARGTFTKHNLDFTNDVLHMAELGFEQISVEPVVSDVKLDYSIREEDLPRVFEEYERLANTIIDRKKAGKGFNFFHFMLDLDQGPCAIKRLRGCGCGNEYIAVTPEGDIFPCHQFVGDESFKMGNVMDGTLNTDMKHSFALANVYSKPECRNCWAKFYCSGGCNANSQQYEGDIHKAHKISCDLEKKRLECAIMIKAAMAE
ncbi:thioether cross-link-forming SCIFF peptide maturase [Caproiciproducens sp. CPB-2]|uniref:thioether cross-link-forming SCIFF peptide maturase n=1 Tax=Caproiciproducens sp. CPB-2 TaxID=3030017 RepID=UPI0023D98B01|nr:thioether cross-link-forming SCIFF peptide maturase [Caproiciproducens sp. CPB-2]MDF1495111.1 thioether cross-link-forming SCIFF peptide maturase [Caproiciproducens sp. CPB-2]